MKQSKPKALSWSYENRIYIARTDFGSFIVFPDKLGNHWFYETPKHPPKSAFSPAVARKKCQESYDELALRQLE